VEPAATLVGWNEVLDHRRLTLNIKGGHMPPVLAPWYARIE